MLLNRSLKKKNKKLKREAKESLARELHALQKVVDLEAKLRSRQGHCKGGHCLSQPEFCEDCGAMMCDREHVGETESIKKELDRQRHYKERLHKLHGELSDALGVYNWNVDKEGAESWSYLIHLVASLRAENEKNKGDSVS